MISLSNEQLQLIMDAVEDYAMLIDEETSFKCEEINSIIQVYLNEVQSL
jgi:hypothetical protein|tara:strand:+ start:267 stop:413 length:147 start_codon:yes stop_codon:yes gene_type:complete